MNIQSLSIKNFRAITELMINPGQINQIVGDNNHGKTTVIKALEVAFNGSTDGSLVKNGEEAAELAVQLTDGTNIRRRITKEGKQTLQVERDGMKPSAPQGYLDILFDHAAFNPLELLDPKGRNEAILKAIDLKVDEATLAAELNLQDTKALPPLDYSQHGLKVVDQCHKYFYQRRAEANKDATDKKKRWETYKADLPELPAEILDAEKVRKQIGLLEKNISAAKTDLNRVENVHAVAKKAEEKVIRYEAELVKIDKDLEREQKEHADRVAELQAFIREADAELESVKKVIAARKEAGQAAIEEAKKEIPSSLPDKAPQLDQIKLSENLINQHKQTLVEIDKALAVKKQHEMVGEMEKSYQEAQAFANMLDVYVAALAGPVKKKIMAAAEMPVTGLEFRDGMFYVEGISVDNLSSSKAMKLAVAVARKLAKKTKIICVDGAELFDDSTWLAFREEIEKDGFSYFVTKVGKPFPGDDKVIQMQDGQVIQ
jgi:DNA repair exonuclease SbcCD ATPase subunit